jgi:hypothetical protein
MATLKTEEEGILTFDVSDEALEISGSVPSRDFARSSAGTLTQRHARVDLCNSTPLGGAQRECVQCAFCVRIELSAPPYAKIVPERRRSGQLRT